MKLLQSIQIGKMTLPNRIFMAPLTRSRAGKENIPNKMMAEYYTQRASAGLIISEATIIDPMGFGYMDVPGIFNYEQMKGWEIVTNSVHESNGKIFCQLWHMGRISHTSFLKGNLPVAPSAINAGGQIRTYEGLLDKSTPRALETNEIKDIVKQYTQAAINSISSGFDGIEIHGANGYLIEQFICTISNQRNDAYGGDIDKRSRFLFEIVESICNKIGNERTGLRLSPSSLISGSYTDNPVEDYSYIINKLNDYNLAYLHLMEPYIPIPEGEYLQYLREPTAYFRNLYNHTLITNSGFTPETAEIALNNGIADAVAFGKLFISNPDLVNRIKNNLPLSPWDTSTFYSRGAEGYLDYDIAE